MAVSGVRIVMVSMSYRYANIGHASVAEGKAFDALSELDNRANSFVPGYQLFV
jgi:hypothetical protein